MTGPGTDEEPTHEPLAHARALLIRAMTCYRDDPRTASWLRERLERLRQPLRIAVTGRVKAGKSTLINALIGAELAPTDAEERSQVNTIYQHGPEPKITVHPPHGSPQNIPVTAVDTTTIRELQRWRPHEVSRLVIEAPVPGLQAISLVETPGVSSSAAQETDRVALAQILSEADAVLYLTRHPHQSDIQFLHSIHELHVARCAPINTIVVFSRADESSDGGLEALRTADTRAHRYRDDPRVRAFAQHVIPVIGLLGQAAVSLSEQDVRTLTQLAALPESTVDELLVSSERFATRTEPTSPTPESRAALLGRFGRFGVHRALTALRENTTTPKKLATTLTEASRLNDLQEAVHGQFVERQDTLRARSALMAVDMVLRANPRSGTHTLHGELEQLLANTHQWREMRLISALRAGQVRFRAPLDTEAQYLLGAFGELDHQRLGHDDQSFAAELADSAGQALARWRAEAINPLHDRLHRDAARTVLRSCERLIAQQVGG